MIVACFNFARLIGHAVSTALMLVGFLILLGFGGLVFIEPHFEHTAQMIKGAGLLSMIGGGYLGIKLSTGGEVFDARCQRDLDIISWLCRAIMVLAICMIATGAWGNYIA